MASQLKSAGLGQSIALAGGSRHWSNPTYIYTSNNQRAIAGPLSIDEYSHWLRATNFGFTIPDGATIDGIKAEIEKSVYDFGMEDYSVKIVKAGTEQGTDKKDLTEWPSTDTYFTYGGATDKWGLTWTSAQINASNFGVSISALYFEDWDDDARVDHVRITVYYTEAVGVNMKIKAGGAWKDAEALKIKASGAWKSGVKAWQKVGGAWKVIFG